MSSSLGNVFVLESLFCVGTLCGGTWEHYVGVLANRRAVLSSDGIEFVQSGGISKKYISKASELFRLL